MQSILNSASLHNSSQFFITGINLELYQLTLYHTSFLFMNYQLVFSFLLLAVICLFPGGTELKRC